MNDSIRSVYHWVNPSTEAVANSADSGSATPSNPTSNCSGPSRRRQYVTSIGAPLPSENSAIALWVDAGWPKNSTHAFYLLIVIIILQNLETTSIDVLFWTVTALPKLVLIFLSMLIGAVAWELARRMKS